MERRRDMILKSQDKNTILYYGQEEVAATYDELRFHGKRGEVIDYLQKEAVFSFLPRGTLKGLKILDVGCGTGRFMKPLAERGATVYGLDASLAMLKIAQKNINRDNCRFIKGDAQLLPFEDNEFDWAISIWVLNHLTAYPAVIHEMMRVSKNIILGLPNKKSIFMVSDFYKKIKGVHNKTGVFKIKRDLKHKSPYSILFDYEEICRIFKQNGYSDITYKGALMFYFAIPEFASNLYKVIDPVLCGKLKPYASFMAIKASA